MNLLLRTAAFAAALLLAPAIAQAAAKPKPQPLPMPKLPAKALHVDFQVEVNAKGQVVRVLHGDLSGDRLFDTMTIGNALQMWIRRPNGTAEAGLYHVAYAYNPKTHIVRRSDPTMLKKGGRWRSAPGAATIMLADAKREAAQTEKRLQAEQMKREEAQAKNLPNIKAIVKKAVLHHSRPPQV